MRANYSRGRSDVLLEDGWVEARGFKLITSHIDLKCVAYQHYVHGSKCMYFLHIATSLKYKGCYCLRKFIRNAQTVLVYDLLVGVEM